MNYFAKYMSKLSFQKLSLVNSAPPTIDCYRVKKVESPLVKLLATDLNLGRGESEAIALASQAGARIIVDDLKARGIAETLNLRVTGTI
ncbi:MAG: hypothetical protein AB1487_08340 [Thermodesulfobacteriota bacterium]